MANINAVSLAQRFDGGSYRSAVAIDGSAGEVFLYVYNHLDYSKSF